MNPIAADHKFPAMINDLVGLYNDGDIAGVVDKYWRNTTVTMNGRTIATSGQEVLAGELAVLEAAPDRKLSITNAVANDNVLAVQAVLSFTDRDSGDKREAHWCASGHWPTTVRFWSTTRTSIPPTGQGFQQRTVAELDAPAENRAPS